MVIWQGRSKKKPISWGKLGSTRGKKKFELGKDPAETKLRGKKSKENQNQLVGE